MNRGIAIFSKLCLVLVLVFFVGVSAAQAKKLPAPEIQVVLASAFPSKVSVLWYEVPGAIAYEVFIRGKEEWDLRKHGGNGGWHAATSNSWHQFSGLMPGNRYTFRVRAINAKGKAGKASKRSRILKAPCWAWERYWQTDQTWSEEHSADPLRPPEGWEGIDNVVGCGE